MCKNLCFAHIILLTFTFLCDIFSIELATCTILYYKFIILWCTLIWQTFIILAARAGNWICQLTLEWYLSFGGPSKFTLPCLFGISQDLLLPSSATHMKFSCHESLQKGTLQNPAQNKLKFHRFISYTSLLSYWQSIQMIGSVHAVAAD